MRGHRRDLSKQDKRKTKLKHIFHSQVLHPTPNLYRTHPQRVICSAQHIIRIDQAAARHPVTAAMAVLVVVMMPMVVQEQERVLAARTAGPQQRHRRVQVAALHHHRVRRVAERC